MARFGRAHKTLEEVDRTRLPRHVAIILDGNGRWAKKRGLPRTAGHAVGVERFRDIIRYCDELGIPFLTVYAFSTENWKRSEEEVSAIMRLLEKYLHEAIDTMEKDNLRLFVLGDQSRLAPVMRELIARTDEISKHTTGTPLGLCLNYGGRDEIVRAARSFAEDCTAGRCKPEDLTEETFARRLYTGDFPDPDLMIRPGGELRLSNFLIWQNAYAEMYFTDVLWPDFSRREFDRALIAYQKRSRRFGDVKE